MASDCKATGASAKILDPCALKQPSVPACSTGILGANSLHQETVELPVSKDDAANGAQRPLVDMGGIASSQIPWVSWSCLDMGRLNTHGALYRLQPISSSTGQRG